MNNAGKALCLIMLAALAACASSRGKEYGTRPLSVSMLKPIETAALSGRDLLSFDVYAEGDRLHALAATATDMPKQPNVVYLRTDDAGQHWSSPIEVGHDASATIESSAGNEIQIAALGDTLMAVLQVTGEIPGMGPLETLYSMDGGRNWTLGANPTGAGSETDQSHPDLVADVDGRFHLVWLDDRDENGYQGVRYARTSDAGQSWELAQTIDKSSCSCCWNRLLIGPEQQVNVLYRDMEPRDMALAQSNDGGQSWVRLSTVGNFNWVFDGCPHNGGGLAWAGNSLQALVWTGLEDKAGLYHLISDDNGKTWALPQAMGGEALAFHSDIAAIDQHLLAIWDARGAEGSVVMISESFDYGKHWSAARQLSTAGSSAQFPRVFATSKGWLALWVEQKSRASKQWMSAILQ